MQSETIAAIAAASHNGSISILRISGPDALLRVSEVFFKRSDNTFIPYDLKKVTTHTIHYGYICRTTNVKEDEFSDNSKQVPDNKINNSQIELLDEVLVLVMKAPRSYTTEDVVEIHCHGGGYIANKILDLIIEKDVRLAEPGEFTKRAYLNGRIDLTQAESVMDVISAQSDIALSSAEGHLQGDIRDRIRSMRETLLTDTAYLEAALDDPEHIELNNFPQTLSSHLDEIETELDSLIQSSENGRIISEGIKTAIVGRPNVGKSSFLNCILREERAIVTDIPGTTRDTLEESVRIGRILLRLIDTAGIRNTEDTIEKIGVEKTKKSIEEADFVICVLDTSEELTKEDISIINNCKTKPGVILLNKSDLPRKISTEIISTNKPMITFSATTSEGLEDLESIIEKHFFDTYYSTENTNKTEIYITNLRQKEALQNAKKTFTHLRNTMSEGLPEDLLTIDLMDAYTCLGQVTGETVEDDLADKIFKDFCMGK